MPVKKTRIEQMREIVGYKQAATVDGKTIDLYSASVYVTCYDSLNVANKAKLESMPIVLACQACLKTLNT